MTIKELLRQIYYNYDMFLKLCQYYLDNSTELKADFSSDTQDPVVGEDVSFTSLSTGDDGFAHLWAFGDGNISDLENPTHAYGEAGSFTVTLVCTDGLGVSDSELKANYIVVSDP